MCKRIKQWLVRHASFDTYLEIAKHLEPIEQILDLARYALFTRTKEGSCLQGTVNPRLHRTIDNAICRSLPYTATLIIVLIVPSLLPQSVSVTIDMQHDTSVISGFIAAVLAIAGIFLTLFYTNVTTIFSNKYPSSSGDIPRLFVFLVSSDKNLNFCTSFVVVASLSFVACVVQRFNWLAFIYIFALTMIMIGKLPSIFSLGTGKTDIITISAIPANRFLVLAKASSFDKSFFYSDYLILNFKKFAQNDLTLIDNLMDYSLAAGDYTPSYAKAVSKITLETLVKYSRILSTIDVESHWHTETSSHKAWFMSSPHELNLAISTGTIPRPDKSIDRLGYQRELYRISNKYGKHLVENGAVIEYSNYFATSTLVLECCIKHGDIEWAKEYSELMLNQCLDLCVSVNADNKGDLQVKCYLLEQYAVMLMTIPLELGKLCDNVPINAFHFDSFNFFSQAELQRQGFPLGGNAKMRAMCKKLEYEYDTFGIFETPKWWFDKNANSFGLETVEQMCSWVLLLHDRFCSTVKNLAKSDPKASYILTLKESELFSKSKHCMCNFRKLAETHFNAKRLAKDYLTELENIHDCLVRTYPDLAKSFMESNGKLEDFFPDLYGFAFFNYCQLLLGDIVNGRLTSFCASIMSLYHLVIISSIDLQKTVSEGSYSNIYKAQILSEPTVFFLELCGMAYVMAELYEDRGSQETVASYISSIIESNPREHARWAACIDLSDNFIMNDKVSMDLFGWRKLFLDAVKESEQYPNAPQYPFGAIEWEPPAGKERLLEMLPANFYDSRDFSGCKVFKKYLLGAENND